MKMLSDITRASLGELLADMRARVAEDDDPRLAAILDAYADRLERILGQEEGP